MSAISDALDHLYETIHSEANAGEWVTYHVGSASVRVLATLETTEVVPQNYTGLEPGGRLDNAKPGPQNVDHDFSILAKDLQLDGVPILPASKHEIKRTFNGRKHVYRLMESSGNGAVWQWQDGYDKRYLIHTKFVRFEEA